MILWLNYHFRNFFVVAVPAPRNMLIAVCVWVCLCGVPRDTFWVEKVVHIVKIFNS